MIKPIIILIAIITLCSQGAIATTVQEANPTKVLVITKDDGTVLVIQPRDLDYKFELDRLGLEIKEADSKSDNQSLLSRIIGGRRGGGKCNRR